MQQNDTKLETGKWVQKLRNEIDEPLGTFLEVTTLTSDCRDFETLGYIRDLEDARRLVACWNACQGIPTEALEAGIIVCYPNNSEHST